MKEITNPPPYQHFGGEPEYLGRASTKSRVTTEREKQKSLENSVFSRLFDGASVHNGFD